MFWRTSDDNSRFTIIKPEAPSVKDTMTKERASESGRSTMGMRDNSRWRKECYERSYDQRIIVDHGEWCIWYDFET